MKIYYYYHLWPSYSHSVKGKDIPPNPPTLVNLQWDDQLNRTSDFIPFWGAE